MMASPAAIGSGIWFPRRSESFPSSIYLIQKEISHCSEARKSRILARGSVKPLVAKMESKDKFDEITGKPKTNDSLASVLFENALNSASGIAMKEKSKSVNKTAEYHPFPVLKYPVATESAIKAILECNTLVFVVDKKANKTIIKETFEMMFRVKAKKVNTLLTPDGTKKAFVMLTREFSAVDVANRVKIL